MNVDDETTTMLRERAGQLVQLIIEHAYAPSTHETPPISNIDEWRNQFVQSCWQQFEKPEHINYRTLYRDLTLYLGDIR